LAEAGIGAPEEGPSPGFLSNLFGLYFGPKEAFTNIVKKPSFWLPLAIFVALQLAFTGLWLSKMDMMEFLRNQADAAGRPFQAPPPQALGFIRGTFWAIAALAGPIIIVVFAALNLFVFRFFYASEVNFKQSMAITSFTSLATNLVTIPLSALVYFLKGDWNVTPQELLKANPGAFFEKDEMAKPLHTLLSGLDLFALWPIFLASVGFGVVSKRTTGSAFWGVAAPWILILLGRVVFAFF
jgi:hypothetical protein